MIKGKSTKREYWLGIRGIYMIWHGEWADPELKYKNHICNYYDIEDSMFQFMKERIADGEDWGDPNNDNDFADFCRAHADYIKSDIIDFSDAMNESLKVSRKNKKINESGDTERGQYMIGRLHRRSAQRSTTDDYYRRRNISKEFDNLFKHNKGNWEAYDKGYEDEGIDLPRLKRGAISANYGTYKMKDMDKIGKKFISFIEKNDAILQLIVDYMSGNQNGEKYSSPLNEVIPEFEDAVLKYETTTDEKKAIERAFNEWWNYAEAELMPEEYYDVDESYSTRKSRKINESEGIFNLSKLEIIEEIIDGLDIPNRESTIKRCLRNTQEYLDSVYNLYLNEIDRGAHIDSIKSSCLKLMNKTNRRTIKRFYEE